MKIRSFAFAALVSILFCSGCHKTPVESAARKLSVPSGFDVPAAMILLFGNYDSSRQLAVYDVPQSSEVDLRGSSFERGDDIEVRPFWISSAREGNTSKVILLTYAIPANNSDFDCHACAPLIGAAVFVRSGSTWRVESSRTAVMRGGGWGQPPESVQIVQIGFDRIGIEIDDTGGGQGETTTVKSLLVPWDGKVNQALETIASDDNKGECGFEDALPCYANHKKLRFVQGKGPDYFDILLTLIGTDWTESEPIITRKVQGTERFQFKNGRYQTVFRNGDFNLVERVNRELDKALADEDQ